MLKAGALIYAVIMGLVISLTSSSLILFSYFSSIQFDHQADLHRVMLNARSGINILLAQPTPESDVIRRADLFNEGRDSVILVHKTWGALEVLSSTGVSKHNRFELTVMAGNDPGNDTSMALWLADMDKPLSLCGKAVLKGTCYLPKAGLKRAYIEGQNFIGDKMVQGEVKASAAQVPSENAALTDRISNLFNETDTKELPEALLPDTLTGSFSDSTVCFYSPGLIYIGLNQFSGNVKIISAKKIVVSRDAVLQDIILAAPEVEVEEGFSGKVQIFARDSLIIGKNVRLDFPSVLGLLPDKTTKAHPVLLVRSGAIVTGVVFALGKHSSPLLPCRVVIQKEALIHGHLFSDALIDLQGSVWGSVTGRKFILTTPSAVYENHLLGGVIDRSKLSKDFVGINLLQEHSVKKIVKWIYGRKN